MNEDSVFALFLRVEDIALSRTFFSNIHVKIRDRTTRAASVLCEVADYLIEHHKNDDDNYVCMAASLESLTLQILGIISSELTYNEPLVLLSIKNNHRYFVGVVSVVVRLPFIDALDKRIKELTSSALMPKPIRNSCELYAPYLKAAATARLYETTGHLYPDLCLSIEFV